MRITITPLQAAEITKQEIGRLNKVVVKRNDPCPCGSGSKFKRCCGRGQNKGTFYR